MAPHAVRVRSASRVTRARGRAGAVRARAVLQGGVGGPRGGAGVALVPSAVTLPGAERGSAVATDGAWFMRVDGAGGSLGVADFAGTAAESSRLHPKVLMLEAAAKDRELTKAGAFDPAGVITHASGSVRVPGASTAVILQLDGASGVLNAANLGDSGFRVVRDGVVAFASQPLQARLSRENGAGRDVEVSEVPVRPGDVIVAGSDGIFGSVSDREILQVTAGALARARGDELEAAREVAREVGGLARARASFGRADDITVVSAIVADADAATMALNGANLEAAQAATNANLEVAQAAADAAAAKFSATRARANAAASTQESLQARVEKLQQELAIAQSEARAATDAKLAVLSTLREEREKRGAVLGGGGTGGADHSHHADVAKEEATEANHDRLRAMSMLRQEKEATERAQQAADEAEKKFASAQARADAAVTRAAEAEARLEAQVASLRRELGAAEAEVRALSDEKLLAVSNLRDEREKVAAVEAMLAAASENASKPDIEKMELMKALEARSVELEAAKREKAIAEAALKEAQAADAERLRTRSELREEKEKTERAQMVAAEAMAKFESAQARADSALDRASEVEARMQAKVSKLQVELSAAQSEAQSAIAEKLLMLSQLREEREKGAAAAAALAAAIEKASKPDVEKIALLKEVDERTAERDLALANLASVRVELEVAQEATNDRLRLVSELRSEREATALAHKEAEELAMKFESAQARADIASERCAVAEAALRAEVAELSGELGEAQREVLAATEVKLRALSTLHHERKKGAEVISNLAEAHQACEADKEQGANGANGANGASATYPFSEHKVCARDTAIDQLIQLRAYKIYRQRVAETGWVISSEEDAIRDYDEAKLATYDELDGGRLSVPGAPLREFLSLASELVRSRDFAMFAGNSGHMPSEILAEALQAASTGSIVVDHDATGGYY